MVLDLVERLLHLGILILCGQQRVIFNLCVPTEDPSLTVVIDFFLIAIVVVSI